MVDQLLRVTYLCPSFADIGRCEQEDPLAAIPIPKVSAAAAPTSCRRCRRDCRDSTGEEGRDAQAIGTVAGRDADRGRDAAQGQVYHV